MVSELEDSRAEVGATSLRRLAAGYFGLCGA